VTAGPNKEYKSLLTWGVQIVTFLFAAFGSFLTNIAPPSETGVSFAVGSVSFLLLIVLLIITAVGRQAPGAKYRTRWIGAGVLCLVLAVPGAFLYSQSWERYTYGFPCQRGSSRHIKAEDKDLTEIAQVWIHDHPIETSPCDLEMNLPVDQIWKPEALALVKRRLLLTYASMVLAVATALFSLIEANAPPSRSGNVPRQRRKAPRRSALDD
jgi:hypothetical protein